MELTLSEKQTGVRAETMKAAVLTGPRRVALVDAPIPTPESGQVRVRMEGCGVCASNVVPWQGPEWMEYPTAPGALGHEGWGVVDSVSPDVEDLEVGDRVVALFQNSYAEYDVGDAEAVIRLPEPLAARPFPGEPIGCAMNIFRRSDIRAGQRVAIIGIGFLGAVLARLATLSGAEVIAITRRRWALDIARSHGAWETIPMEDHTEIVQRVAELTGGAFCERVIEATGKQWPLDLASEIAGERAKLIVAGYHQDGPRTVNMQQWNWKGIDVVNAHERQMAQYRQGVVDGIRMIEDGALSIDDLLTHRLPLARLGEALELTQDRPEGFMKAMVTFP